MYNDKIHFFLQLNSLKQLAVDLSSFAEANSDVIVFSRENESFLTCRFILASRAPTLLQVSLNFGKFLNWRGFFLIF